MKMLSAILLLAFVTTGCTTRSTARLKQQNAFLTGQNAALQQQALAVAQAQGVAIVGAVQNPAVPWVEGLTLAQAIATAKFTGADAPRQIIITRNGESATLDGKVLLNGTEIPLEKGDVVELR
jgi:protein involved in polysaccharide export with SLBB domain